jgi:hypothetical protein
MYEMQENLLSLRTGNSFKIAHGRLAFHACVQKRHHFGVQALNLAWYRAGTNDENDWDENDWQERITRIVTNGSLFA